MQISPLFELILYKSYAELKTEAARLYASFLWWIIEPVMYMGAFYIVFGLVFQRGGPGFVPFLLCGLVIWKWFASSVTHGANSIIANMGLIQMVYVQKFVFPGATLLTNTVRFLFVFFMFIIFLVLYGISPKTAWLGLPVVLITQFLLNAACSGFASAVVPFVPDIRLLIEKILMLGFFMSGIFFDSNSIPEKYQGFFLMNPMAVLIEEYREILLHGRWPDWKAMAIITIVSIVGIMISRALMIRYDRHYPKVLMQ